MFEPDHVVPVRLSRDFPHEEGVSCVAFSEDLEFMVTASDDYLMHIWNTRMQEMICVMEGHSGPINCIAVSGDSKMIASGSHDKSVNLWLTRRAELLHSFLGHESSVEAVVFSSCREFLVSAGYDHRVIIWSIANLCQVCSALFFHVCSEPLTNNRSC